MKKFFLITVIAIMALFPIKTYAKAISTIAMDLDTGRVLYSNNINEKRLIASITKVLTAIIVLETTDIEKEVEVGTEVLKMYGTNIYIEPGEKITIKDLLYGLLLRSGNDAAVTLAVATAGSEEKFVELMNQKAKEIGMKNSTFKNPHGLDEDTKNYSTAYDMALLSKYAYKNKTYRQISSTKKYESTTINKTYLWYNRNSLLNNYKYCTGGKNGYTPSAGKTLITTAKKNNLNLTIVTLNDDSKYETHQKLYEQLFAEYENYKIVDKNSFDVKSKNEDEILYLKKSFSYPLTKKEIYKIKTLVTLTDNSKNTAGTIKIYLGDKKIGQLDIYKKSQKKKENFLRKFKNLFTWKPKKINTWLTHKSYTRAIGTNSRWYKKFTIRKFISFIIIFHSTITLNQTINKR